MRLVEANKSEASLRGKWADLVDEFLRSDMECAEIVDIPCSIGAAYRALAKTCKLFTGVRASVGKGRLYLVREVIVREAR